jgi:hypothetical protein
MTTFRKTEHPNPSEIQFYDVAPPLPAALVNIGAAAL